MMRDFNVKWGGFRGMALTHLDDGTIGQFDSSASGQRH